MYLSVAAASIEKHARDGQSMKERRQSSHTVESHSGGVGIRYLLLAVSIEKLLEMSRLLY